MKDISKKQLFQFLETMSLMAWYKDKNGKFIYVNQHFANGCGKTKEEIIGKTDYEVWPLELAKAYVEDDQLVMASGQQKLIEEPIEDQSGGVWFETFKAPIFDEDGNVIGTIGTAKDVTLRKKYQIELQNQKQFSKYMMDVIPDLIFFKDLNGAYLGCNKAFAQHFIGTTEEEIIGKTDMDFVADSELAQFFIERDQTVIKSGKTMSNEEIVQYANGEHIHLETVKTPFVDGNGNISGLIGVARDITDRKHIEFQLKESELRLNLATGSTKIGLWDWEVQTGKTVFNDQWAEIIGYTLEELAPHNIENWAKFTHPDDLEKSNQILQDHFEGNTDLYECEVRMLHKDNHWVWVLDRGKVTEWDSDKKPLRMLGTHIDIDKQKQTEFRLRKQEQILSAVALSIKELITNRDYYVAIEKCFQLIGQATLVDRVYLFVNSYDHNGNGFTSQAIEWNSGVAQSQIMNPDLQNIPFEYVGGFVDTLNSGDVFLGVVNEMNQDRTRELLESQGIRSLIVLPIFVRESFWGFIGFDECKYDRIWEENEFSTLMAFSHSVEKSIERRLIEDKLNQAKSIAETANVLKSEFVANISHEIRTPIHAILGYAALIKEHATDQQCMGYLTAIQKAGDALMGLINDILDLSKIEAGKLELQSFYADVRTVLSDVEQVFKLRIKEKHLELRIQVDPRLPHQILFDEVRVRQILFNLVGNAVKFTHRGYITIKILMDAKDEILEQVNLTIVVEDSGIGIPLEQQIRIFEPFKQKDGQSNKNYGGTGLGLSITQRLVQMMGGTIELESQMDVGSVFKVSLIGLPYKLIESVDTTFDSKFSFMENDYSMIGKGEESFDLQVTMPHELLNEILILKDKVWVKCIENNRVSEIRHFSESLEGLGTHYEHRETLDFANKIKLAIEAYDLKKVKELLEYFPSWVLQFTSDLDKGV